MFLPQSRGPLSAAVTSFLGDPERSVPGSLNVPIACADPVTDDDFQLAMWICYELHYRGFDDVAGDLEWSPAVIAFRGRLEHDLLEALRSNAAVPPSDAQAAERLRDLVESDDGPQLSRHLQTQATLTHFREWAVHRSVYQLKEADPHTWVIPRLSGRAKAALVSIQMDEYGDGDQARMHSELYRDLLRGVGLSDEYGYYVDAVPGVTLAISNVMSMFGLRRDLRAACVGHLAAYEMTSSVPCRRYGRGARRLGLDDATCRFFDEHVTADALHEQLAMHDLCGGLAADEPDTVDDILFGAAACLYVDGLFATHVFDAWDDGRSSLRGPVRFDDLPPRGAPRLRAVS